MKIEYFMQKKNVKREWNGETHQIFMFVGELTRIFTFAANSKKLFIVCLPSDEYICVVDKSFCCIFHNTYILQITTCDSQARYYEKYPDPCLLHLNETLLVILTSSNVTDFYSFIHLFKCFLV